MHEVDFFLESWELRATCGYFLYGFLMEFLFWFTWIAGALYNSIIVIGLKNSTYKVLTAFGPSLSICHELPYIPSCGK